MANGSMAVVPSSPCIVHAVCGGPVACGMRHSPADGNSLPHSRDYDEIRGGTTHTNNFPGDLGASCVPSLADKVDDGGGG
jgi:hypothetical protein